LELVKLKKKRGEKSRKDTTLSNLYFLEFHGNKKLELKKEGG